MFRRSRSTLLRTIAVVSLCVLTSPGCSRHEQIKVNEKPPEDGSTETGRFATADAGSLRGASPATGGSQLRALNATLDESIRYVVPEGWSPTQVGGLQKAAFEIQEGPLAAEMTVMGLPGSATQLLPNVNLWRKQIGLENTTQEDLDAALEAIEVDGRGGHYIRLVGPSDAERPLAMLVVLASDQDHTWFFKMLGDSELVLREKEHFREFVRSVKFVPEGGDESD